MVLVPIPQSLPVHFFGSRPQPPTSRAFPVSFSRRYGRGKQKRHVTYEWVMSRTNESCHVRMSRVTYELVMRQMTESCHIWMSHVIYECVMSRMIESSHMRMGWPTAGGNSQNGALIYSWYTKKSHHINGLSLMNESCHIQVGRRHKSTCRVHLFVASKKSDVTWVGRVAYEWIMLHTKESCLSYDWVMSHVNDNEKYHVTREVGGWGRDSFSRNLMSPTPHRKWYLTTGCRFH